jgi:hypothetical protein
MAIYNEILMGSQWEPGNKQAMVKRWSKTHWGLPSLWQKTDVWFKTGVFLDTS